jgi:transcription antitermination factor NusA-like protein
MVHKAIGEHGNNIKRMQDQLGKRIRVVQEPDGVSDIARFILDIIKPVDFKEVEVKEQEIIITAGSQNKAALIGRNRRRHEELNQILKDIFGKELTIL